MGNSKTKQISYNKSPKLCLNCNSKIEFKNRRGKFCCVSCSAKYANPNRKTSEYTKGLISNSVKKWLSINKPILIRYNHVCKICNSPFISIVKNSKVCGLKCRGVSAGRVGGKISASKQIRRSKNEMYFYDMCLLDFKGSIHNEPIFNGWDADVIIPELKVAVLWNGNWHHKKITKKHSVKQTQNRDRLKIKHIKKCGYIPYVIDDFGSENIEFVKQEYLKFQTFLINLKC